MTKNKTPRDLHLTRHFSSDELTLDGVESKELRLVGEEAPRESSPETKAIMDRIFGTEGS